MELTNIKLVYFCQNLLGAPYWFNTTTIKATKNAYKINSLRFPEEYTKRPETFYEQAIADNEIVTDSVGLVKGFLWTNGGQNVLENRGNEFVHKYTIGANGCPDKSANGLFVWATEQGAKWGEIDNLPNVPGLILTYHGYLGVYEGNGFVIHADRDQGQVVREKIENKPWRFWYQLPCLDYEEQIVEKIKSNAEQIEEPKEIKLEGIAIAIGDVLFREGISEDSKLLGVIKMGQKVETFNDSNNKLLHLMYEDKEGYSATNYYTYYPKKPNIISSEEPKEYIKKQKGIFILQENVGLRTRAHVRANTYIVLPKNTEVFATGGVSGDYVQVYAEFNKKTYVGYIDKKFLKRVAYLEK